MDNDNTQIMNEYTLEKHLKSLCDINDGYDVLVETWDINKKRFKKILRGAEQTFPTFSMHDFSHSQTIINSIEKLLGESRIKKLEPTETWLILHGALLHDWGMVITDNNIKDTLSTDEFEEFLKRMEKSSDKDLKKAAYTILNFEKEYKQEDTFSLKAYEVKKCITLLIQEYFRSKHAYKSRDYISSNIFDGLNLSYDLIQNRLLEMLSDIVCCHAKDFKSIFDLPTQQNGIKNDVFHPRFIAALLRIGDLLDMDNLRFNKNIYEALFSALPQTSENHRQKHLALKHFLITDTKIEIEIDCDNSDVYRVAKQWLSWIKKDLENLAINWGEIVPTYFTGYLPFVSEQKVLINGQDTGHLQTSFEKDDIYQILKGNNLYSEDNAYLRELIQNALDASKIQIVRDIKTGRFPKLIYDKLEDLTPFDLIDYEHGNIFENYPIEINFNVIDKDGDQKVVEVNIKDHGTGIDGTALKNLAKISTSYQSRDIWKKEILKMPKWLRPTGGFGIGLQSVFNVTNKITMVTKTSYSEKAKKIEMYSLDDGGYINVMEVEDEFDLFGTIVSLEVPFLLAKDSEQPYFTSRGGIDFSVKDNRAEAIIYSLIGTIRKKFNENFFEIKINDKLKNNKNADLTKFDIYNNIRYCFSLNDKKKPNVKFWNKETNSLISFGLHVDDSRRLSFLYKGVKLSTIKPIETPIQIKIDLYGEEVTNCLTISREELNKDFYKNLGNDFCIPIINDYLDIYKHIILENKYEYYFDSLSLFIACVMHGKEFNIDLENVKDKRMIKVLKNKNGEIYYDTISSVELIKHMRNNDVYCIVTSANHLFIQEMIESMNKNYEQYKGYELIIIDRNVSKLLLNNMQITSAKSVLFNGKTKNLCKCDLRMRSSKYILEMQKTEFINKLNENISDNNMIVTANKEYEKLIINIAPYYDSESDNQLFAEMICPITKSDEENIPRMNEDEFVNYILNIPTFNNLLKYTISNQNTKDKYSINEIKDEYARLIRDIYISRKKI